MDINTIRSDRLRRAFNALPSAARADIQGNDQMVLKADPYYSKGRISAQSVAVASGVSTINFLKQDITLFDYAKGDNMGRAGFPTVAPYDRATDADTNLYAKGETNGSEYVFIDGISIILSPTADAELVRRLLPNMYVGLSVGGIDNFVRFGNPLWLGGGGGVSGGGDSRLLTPGLDQPRALHVYDPTLGLPSVNDVKQLPDSIVWGPKGKVDSSISLKVSLLRDTILTSTSRAADVTNRIAAFNAPPAATAVADVDGTYLEFYVLFQCVQIGPRSNLR